MSQKIIRPRGANWTEGEKIALVEEVLKREECIFGKFTGSGNTGTGGVTTRDKEQAWEAVRNIVNAVSSSNKTCEQCRKQYHNIKQRVKEGHDEARYPKTGGGPAAASPPPSKKLLWEGMGSRPGLRGISKPLDTEDPKFGEDVETCQSNSQEASVPESSTTCTFEGDASDCTEKPPVKKHKGSKPRRELSVQAETELLHHEVARSKAEQEKLQLECMLLKQRIANEKEKHLKEMSALKDEADRRQAEMECLALRKKVLKEELDVLTHNALLRQALSS